MYVTFSDGNAGVKAGIVESRRTDQARDRGLKLRPIRLRRQGERERRKDLIARPIIVGTRPQHTDKLTDELRIVRRKARGVGVVNRHILLRHFSSGASPADVGTSANAAKKAGT